MADGQCPACRAGLVTHIETDPKCILYKPMEKRYDKSMKQNTTTEYHDEGDFLGSDLIEIAKTISPTAKVKVTQHDDSWDVVASWDGAPVSKPTGPTYRGDK